MKILLTAAGFQGGYSLVKELQNKGIYVIGTDMNGNSAAQKYCDNFYKIAEGKSNDFIPQLQIIVNAEKPDIILPASSDEIEKLSHAWNLFNIPIMVSPLKESLLCLNKVLLYQTLRNKIDIPAFIWSQKGYMIKPADGKGGKGIQEIPLNSIYIMEKLEGEEIDVDVLSWKGELLLACCKIREKAYGGTLIQGEIVERPYIIEQVKKILKVVPLSYLSVFQFIDGKLLEINPRIAGSMIYTDNFNLPYLAIKLALGQIKPKDIKNEQNNVPIGQRIYKTMINL